MEKTNGNECICYFAISFYQLSGFFVAKNVHGTRNGTAFYGPKGFSVYVFIGPRLLRNSAKIVHQKLCAIYGHV